MAAEALNCQNRMIRFLNHYKSNAKFVGCDVFLAIFQQIDFLLAKLIN